MHENESDDRDVLRQTRSNENQKTITKTYISTKRKTELTKNIKKWLSVPLVMFQELDSGGQPTMHGT